MTKRITREQKTVSLMIGMYCRNFHQGDVYSCDFCKPLLAYAERQTENCKFGKEKPVCSACPVHCYKREMRSKIREVMRFAGPRMIIRHPYYAIMHLLDKRKDETSQHKFKTYTIK